MTWGRSIQEGGGRLVLVALGPGGVRSGPAVGQPSPEAATEPTKVLAKDELMAPSTVQGRGFGGCIVAFCSLLRDDDV